MDDILKYIKRRAEDTMTAREYVECGDGGLQVVDLQDYKKAIKVMDEWYAKAFNYEMYLLTLGGDTVEKFRNCIKENK